MKKKRFNRFLAWMLQIPICEKCDSLRMEKGHYTRGYNELCRQAYGDTGYFCKGCCKVSFITPLEEHKQILAKAAPWCIPHK